MNLQYANFSWWLNCWLPWVFLKATSIFWVGGLLLHGPVGTRTGFVRSSFKFLHGGEWHSARKKCRVHFGKVFGEICGPMPKRSLRSAFLLFLFQKSKLQKQQTYCDPVKRLNIVRPCLLMLPQTKGYQSGRYLEPFPRVVLESHEAHRYT